MGNRKHSREIIKNRRQQVLRLWLCGKSQSEIAEKLNYDEGTIFNDVAWLKTQSPVNITDDKRIKEVYLPPEPPDEEVLFKKENKFTRPIPPEYLQNWMDEYEFETERIRKEQEKYPEKNIPDYVHPHQAELNKWEQREFERTTNGIWFWNNGVKTYITGDNYKYLTQWKLKFGYPDYWDADKEVFYWIKFWEEDPDSYGGLLNTGRRTGKSTKMGFWIMNRVSTNFNHLAGMQGEDNTKIKAISTAAVVHPNQK